MADPKGFLETPAVRVCCAAARRPAAAGLERGLRGLRARGAGVPGRTCMNAASRSATGGARWQPDPGVEHAGLAGMTGRTRSSGCTPRTTSRSSPGRCAAPARQPGCWPSTTTRDDQAGRDRNHRPGLGGGWVTPQPRRCAPAEVAVIGSGPAGLARRTAAHPGRPDVVCVRAADRIGGLLRYGHPRVQDGKHRLTGGWRSSRPRARVPAGVEVGVDITVEDLRPTSTPSCWPAAPPVAGPAVPGASWRHLPVHGVPAAVNAVQEAIWSGPITPRAARRDHRWR